MTSERLQVEITESEHMHPIAFINAFCGQLGTFKDVIGVQDTIHGLATEMHKHYKKVEMVKFPMQVSPQGLQEPMRVYIFTQPREQ